MGSNERRTRVRGKAFCHFLDDCCGIGAITYNLTPMQLNNVKLDNHHTKISVHLRHPVPHSKLTSNSQTSTNKMLANKEAAACAYIFCNLESQLVSEEDS